MKMEIGTFKALATGISSLRDDAVKLELKNEGLTVSCMDTSQISMVKAVVPFISKEEGEIEGTAFNVDFEKCLKAVKSEKDGILSLKANNKVISITAGTSEAVFPEEEEYNSNQKCPTLEDRERVKATFEAKALKDAIKEVGENSTYAKLIWDKSVLVIEGKSDIGTVRKTFNASIIQEGKGSVLYPVSMLKDCLKAIKKGTVLIFFNKLIPCELQYEVDGVKFNYWIAPACDSDEEEETAEATVEQKTETATDEIAEQGTDATETQETATATATAIEQAQPEQQPEAKPIVAVATAQAQETATQEQTATTTETAKIEEKQETAETEKPGLKKFRITIEAEIDEELEDIGMDYLDGCWLMDADFRGVLTKILIKKLDKDGNEVD